MTSIHSSLASSQSASSLSVHSVADTVTSTTALTAAHRPPQKDYAAAFAALQAQYGMSGDFPARPAIPTKKKQSQRKPASSEATPPPSTSPAENPSSSATLNRHTSPALPPASENPSEVLTPEGGQEIENDKGKVSKLKRLFSVRLRKGPTK